MYCWLLPQPSNTWTKEEAAHEPNKLQYLYTDTLGKELAFPKI